MSAFTAVYGLNADGHPKQLDEVLTDIVEDEIRRYVKTHLAIARAGGLDSRTLDQVEYLHLAEPWLPAVGAKNRIIEALALTEVIP